MNPTNSCRSDEPSKTIADPLQRTPLASFIARAVLRMDGRIRIMQIAVYAPD
jgi:hypothetical protein